MPNNDEKIKKLSQFKDPYSSEGLSKHIDSVLYDDLGKLQIQTDEPKERHVMIVFWDISGFSQMCKDLNDYPEAIKYFLNDYFKIAIEVIKKHNGGLDKFIEDGILGLLWLSRSKIIW